jgi:hypothetical protein
MIDRDAVQHRLENALAYIKAGDFGRAEADLVSLRDDLRTACQPALSSKMGEHGVAWVPEIDFYRAAGRVVQAAASKGHSGDWRGAQAAIRAALNRFPIMDGDAPRE